MHLKNDINHDVFIYQKNAVCVSIMNKYLLFTILLFCTCLYAGAQTFAPVNPNSSPEVRRILKLLYTLKGKYIISGEHNYNQSPDVFSDSVKAITGKYPALWGTDFIMNGMEDPGQRIVKEAIKKNSEGYLVTLMWHEGRPTDQPPYGWKESVQGKLTDAQWQELITPGTALHQKWLKDIDRIAGYLKQLQEAHVPVL